MNKLLSQSELDTFRAKAAASAHPRELIVDLLRAIQDHHGWVPDEGIELAAEILGLSPLQIEEIATFYDKIFRQPVGRKVIHVCDSICCWATGSEEVAGYLRRKLGIDFGETTADGAFTLLPTCCLGACGDAPAMMIGLTLYGRLTPEKIDAALEKEKSRSQESGVGSQGKTS
ncbi:NADH dehydrogenase subunit E [Geothermobacter ehrlichii]|uniref:NADH dehydrogenase subunit E n=1 Tax=Geothermobacter ehrlichii TaxID=213224 RepID=A0A5D3WJZ1_9BACT|nr:NADH-quinone oxidoreductase subunit NuoE [Geothermobacter ehrlichii]TYO99282.1 NADH dehydrogenase subunit E [Geothermobacter ehrlichii]